MSRWWSLQRVVYIVSLALFAFAVILPLLSIFVDSFVDEKSGFTLANYEQIFDSKTLFLLLSSLKLAFWVSSIATLLGGFFAFVLTKTDLPLRGLFRFLFLTPLFLSPYILTLSWVDFFLQFEGGEGFIYSFWGAVFVLSLVFMPLSMIIISSSLSNINSRLEEAGLMITTYPRVVLQIILPLVLPAILSSSILIFVLTLSEFSVPAFLSIEVLTTEIFRQFSAFYNYGVALANSVLLVIVSVSFLMIDRYYLLKGSFFSIGTKAHHSKTIELGRSKYLLLGLCLLYLMLFVATPLIVLGVNSFRDGTEHFYHAIELLSPLVVPSLFYAMVGATILVLFGVIFAYISEREGYRAVHTILLVVFGVPSTVLGIGLIKFFNTPSLDFIYGSFWIIIVAYLGKFLFISHQLIANAIKQIPLSLEESATLMGASFWTRLTKITLPMIGNILFITFIISFIFSLGELGTTILVYPAGTSVMGIKLYTIMANAPQGLSSAMSLVIVAVTFLALGVFGFIYKRVS